MDDLIYSGLEAVKEHGGSYRTVAAHNQEIKKFVDDLRDIGYGVQKWNNLTMRHISEVVNRWQDRKLTAATIKEYMSGVRIAARQHGNKRIANSSNEELGIANRTYIDNIDKSTPPELYNQVVEQLKSSQDIRDNAVAAQLQLQRELGLRAEESWKFSADRDMLHDGRAYISAGTKGGRERMIPADVAQAPGAATAIQYARVVQSRLDNKKSTIPQHISQRSWRGYYYRAVRAAGLTKQNGGSSHGNRHAWAQSRYRLLTGFDARVKFDSRREFVTAAKNAVGDTWSKLDKEARLQIKSELGHGPDRDDVASQTSQAGQQVANMGCHQKQS